MFEQFDGLDDGFGISSMEELKELHKALDIGYTQPTTGTGFDALRVESLESTLKLTTYSQEHLRIWNKIPKTPAYSTVEEYNRLDAYGSEAFGFLPSGELPEEEDSTYTRADQKVKYLGTTRAVHHPATLVRTVPADIIAQETMNGTLWMLKQVNSALYYGNADVNQYEWNGLFKQLDDGGATVIDLQGTVLDSNDLEDAAQVVIDNYGQPGSIFANAKVFTDFTKPYASSQRFIQPGAAASMPATIGTPINGYNTQNGLITFEADLFMKRGGIVPAAATSNKAPAAPTLAIGSPGSDTDSSFMTGENGNYKYQVTATNRFGESLPCALSSAAAINAGDKVTITITDGGGAYEATGYKIYRTEKNGSITYYTHKAIARSKTAGVFQATTTYDDKNKFRPRCYNALVLDLSMQSLTFRQLAPLLKMPLAVVSPAIRWMQLLYGTPIVFTPKKNVIIRNIGAS